MPKVNTVQTPNVRYPDSRTTIILKNEHFSFVISPNNIIFLYFSTGYSTFIFWHLNCCIVLRNQFKFWNQGNENKSGRQAKGMHDVLSRWYRISNRA